MLFYSFFLHLAIFEYFNDTLIHSLSLIAGWVLMSFVGGSCQDCSMGSLLNSAVVNILSDDDYSLVTRVRVKHIYTHAPALKTAT